MKDFFLFYLEIQTIFILGSSEKHWVKMSLSFFFFFLLFQQLHKESTPFRSLWKRGLISFRSLHLNRLHSVVIELKKSTIHMQAGCRTGSCRLTVVASLEGQPDTILLSRLASHPSLRYSTDSTNNDVSKRERCSYFLWRNLTLFPQVTELSGQTLFHEISNNTHPTMR